MLDLNDIVVINKVLHFVFFDRSHRLAPLAGLFCAIIEPFSGLVVLFDNYLNAAIYAYCER